MSERLLFHLLDASLRAVVLAGVAGIAVSIVRKNAGVRHGVWAAVLFGMLFLLVAGPGVPRLPLQLAPPWPQPLAPAVEPGASGGSASAATSVIVRTANTVPAEPAAWSWGAALYLGVAALLLARVGLAIAYGLRLRRRATRTELATPGAEVRESGDVRVPVTIGVLKPAILLPAHWRDWPAERLAAAIAHEAAHVRRRDWLTGVLAAANKALFWFHPLAWWLERRLATLAEHAADDAALLAVGDRNGYARALLDVAAALEGARWRVFEPGAAMARSSQVGRRIEAILDASRTVPRGLTARGCVAVAACAVPVLYAAAAVQVGSAPPAPPPGEDMQECVLASLEGEKLSAAGANELERKIANNPDDLVARVALLAYYRKHSLPMQRVQHAMWLIEHRPESDVFRMAIARILPEDGPANTRADYDRAKLLWLQQTARRPDDARVLANAASFLIPEDLASAADLLKQARRIAPGDAGFTSQLAALYASAIKGMNPNADDPFWKQPAFAAAATAELESSNDAQLLGAAGRFLASPFVLGQTAVTPTLDLAERLLRRAVTLNPSDESSRRLLQSIASWREQSGPAGGVVGGVPGGVGEPIPPARPVFSPPPPGVQRIRVGAGVQAAKLKFRADPIYPATARQARIQGTVRFDAIIAADGTVANLQVMSGHPLLIPAAQEAVRHWEYRPTLLNGQPVEVVTQIDVPFVLPQEN